MRYLAIGLLGLVLIAIYLLVQPNLDNQAIGSVGANEVIKPDTTAPISRIDNSTLTGHIGQNISGQAFDLGSGVAFVSIQIQREKDGFVWDGLAWQSSVGETQTAEILGDKFNFKIPVALLNNEKYIIRSQAIDNRGNAQTKWSEIVLVGTDIGTPEMR